MTRNDIFYERLCQVVCQEFPRSELPITQSVIASQVTGWDSLGHNRLIIAIENEFKVKLPLVESLYVDSVRQLGELLLATLENQNG